MIGRIPKEKEVFKAYYETHEHLFHECGKVLSNLLRAILVRPLDVQISYRVKELDKCVAKIDRKYVDKIRQGRTASKLITDVIGARVVCLYQDEIGLIIAALRHNFEFVEAFCTDKITELEETPGLFGYRAVHVVARFNRERRRLQEYKKYRDLIFEIQIRTIVQDAWASINRKIAYDKDVPSELRRRLLTLAALFELADREFLSVRATISRNASN